MRLQLERRIKEIAEEHQQNLKIIEDLEKQIDLFYNKKAEIEEKNNQLAGGFTELKKLLEDLDLEDLDLEEPDTEQDE